MIKVSRLADYAVVVLMTLAAHGERGPMSAAGLARTSRLPEPTVAKVLKALARRGLVLSTRGAGGGYRLGRPAGVIGLAEIIAAVDGPIALTACVDGGEECCDFSAHCPSKDRWGIISAEIRKVLDGITLGDMIEGKGIFNPVYKTENEQACHEHIN